MSGRGCTLPWLRACWSVAPAGGIAALRCRHGDLRRLCTARRLRNMCRSVNRRLFTHLVGCMSSGTPRDEHHTSVAAKGRPQRIISPVSRHRRSVLGSPLLTHAIPRDARRRRACLPL